MNGYAFGYSIGNKGTAIHDQYSNSSLIATPEEAALHSVIDTDVDVDEALFLILAIFLLYCYVGLLRQRVHPSASAMSLSDDFGIIDVLPDQRNLKRSGLTTEIIEARLKSFTVDSWLSEQEAKEDVSSNTDEDHCTISFGQESCAICLESYKRQKFFRALPCDHIFHQGKFTT